jgi:hypothetical protein
MHIIPGILSAAVAALAVVLLGVFWIKKKWLLVILWGLIFVLQTFSAVIQLMYP